jgi:hypothetical protein
MLTTKFLVRRIPALELGQQSSVLLAHLRINMHRHVGIPGPGHVDGGLDFLEGVLGNGRTGDHDRASGDNRRDCGNLSPRQYVMGRRA